jgi:hypothetical protein
MVTIQYFQLSLQLVAVAQQLLQILVVMARQFRAVQVQAQAQTHHHRQQVAQLHQVKATQVVIPQALQREQVAVEQVRLEVTQRQIQLELAALV